MKQSENKKEVRRASPFRTKKAKLLAGVVVVAVLGVGIWAWSGNDKPSSYVPPVNKGDVAAIVGGEKVLLRDLQNIKNEVPQLKDIPMEVVYQQLLEAYVNNKIILKQAEKAGLEKNAEVKKALKNARDQILFQAYLSKQLESRMTPDKLQSLYQQYVQTFTPKDEIHARHILLKTQKEAEDLIVKLKAGADFSGLANQYSLDKGPANGGDLGYFSEDMMIPEFTKAAFALNKGKFTQKPIKTVFGWHVIKVEDKRKSSPLPYEEVEEMIKSRFSEMAAGEIIKEERAKANVQIFNLFEKKPAEVAPVESIPVESAPVEEAVTIEDATVEEVNPVELKTP